MGPGNHILEWKYSNQLAEGEYDNAFYIDDITVGNAFDIYRANCDGSNAELIASNIADAHYVDYGWDALPIGQYKYGISTDGGNTIDWSECLEKDVMVVDENNAMEIKVYPNPTNNVLFVHITDETQQIDVTDLAEGMYFVRIQGDEEFIIKKFCIVK